MKKMILAATLLLAFSAQAQTAQPCASRAKGSLRVSKNYDNLLNESAGKSAVVARPEAKAKGAR